MSNETKKRSRFVYIAAASVNLMSAIAGMGYAWPSPFIPKLNGSDDPELNPLSRPTTLLEDSWLASLQNLGAMSGPLFTGIMAKWMGKKKTLLTFSLSFVTSSLIMIFANTVWHFYVARFLVGIGTGAVFSLIPIYVAEISEVHQRGVTAMMLTLMMVIVQFGVYVVSPYITVGQFGVLTLAPSLVFLIIFGFFVPESPYQLVIFEKLPEAEKALCTFRNKKDVQKELLEITKDIELTQEDISMANLLKSKIIRKSLLISIGLLFFQQFTGILPLISFLQTIFDTSNGPIPGDKAVMLVGFVQIITVSSVTLLINSIGRKILLYFSHIGLFFSLVFLGIYFYLQSHNYNLNSYSWVPIASVCLYILAFNVGSGPLPWSIIGEIFPSNYKSYLSSITVLSMLLTGFLISMVFPTMSVYMGLHGLMWTFAGFVFCGGIFIWLVVPETQGKSFVEIQSMLDGKRREKDEFLL